MFSRHKYDSYTVVAFTKSIMSDINSFMRSYGFILTSVFLNIIYIKPDHPSFDDTKSAKYDFDRYLYLDLSH